MTFPSEETTQDDFLGGRLRIWQPKRGYRAGVDAVFLAAACPAEPGQSVLELGCGVGVASLCLAARVPNLSVLGLEREGPYADLAKRNGLAVLRGDLADMPLDLRQQSFDHVIANPPYFDRTTTQPAPDPLREAAMGEDTPLAIWVQAARKRLKPKGWLTMIQAAHRLPDILEGLGGFGSVTVLPLSPRAGRPAKLLLLRARKMGAGPFCLRSPILIHQGAGHHTDEDSYTPEISSVLREGSAFPGFENP